MRKNSIPVLFALIAMASSLIGGQAQNPASIRVMSYNIRCLNIESDPRDLWWFRKDDLAHVILKNDPDIIGMQEVYTTQARHLQKYLKGYAWFGPPRDDGKKKGERNPIFYKTDRFELLDQNTFWLSETPEVMGSQSWGADCKRIVTWGRFRDKRSGRIFFHFNTHFDNGRPQAREMSANLLVERIKKIAGDTPLFVTGDFNSDDKSQPYKTMTAYLLDSRAIGSTPPKGPYCTSWTFKPGVPADVRIDYIFVSKGVSASDYAAINETYHNGRRPSDHMPVMATIQIP